jgi:Leucine rich repeat
LAGNNITRLPPSVFDGMTKLQTLKLNDNEIRVVEPETFKNLISLKHIDLHGNQLTTFSVDLLKAIRVPSVKVSLQKNAITSFIVSTTNKQINYLDLQYNKMTTMPTDLDKLTGLTQLLMSNNPLALNRSSFRKLPSSLTQLFLSNVGLSSVPNPLAIFSGLNNLQALSIGKNSLTSLTNMPYLPKLNTLMLYDNLFPGDIDFETIKTNLPLLEKIGLSQSEPQWSCTQVARMLSQLEELGIARFFYKSSSKIFGIGNNVGNIGCENTEDNQRNERLSNQVVQLQSQIAVLEGQLKAQSVQISSQATKLAAVEQNLLVGKEMVTNQFAQIAVELKTSKSAAEMVPQAMSKLETIQKDVEGRLMTQTVQISSQATRLAAIEQKLLLGKENVSKQIAQIQAQLESEKLAAKKDSQDSLMASRLDHIQKDLAKLSQDFEDFSICESFERCRSNNYT